jgi:hypothetical protein
MVVLMRNVAGKQTTVVLALTLWLAFTTAYLVLAPSVQHQNWDSLCYPSLAEGPGFGIVNNRHPVGHIILNGSFWMAEQGGYHGRALRPFVMVNSLMGGACVAMLFVCLRAVMSLDLLTALALCLLTGGSAGFLSLMPTGDIYAITVLSSVAAWTTFLAAIRNRFTRPWLWTAVAAALAPGCINSTARWDWWALL